MPTFAPRKKIRYELVTIGTFRVHRTCVHLLLVKSQQDLWQREDIMGIGNGERNRIEPLHHHQSVENIAYRHGLCRMDGNRSGGNCTNRDHILSRGRLVRQTVLHINTDTLHYRLKSGVKLNIGFDYDYMMLRVERVYV